MGTVLAIMGGYYLLSGQAFKAAGEAAKWIDEKVIQSKDKKKYRCYCSRFTLLYTINL